MLDERMVSGGPSSPTPALELVAVGGGLPHCEHSGEVCAVMPELNTIIQGDALQVLKTWPPDIIHCIVTSPPYWGLRDYKVECQIGLEPTLEAYIEKILEVMAECRRVLRPDGTLWLNLGDSYSGSGKAKNPSGKQATNVGSRFDAGELCGNVPRGLKPKDLCGVPWRVALALQEDGWWLRSDIIWSKPNPMPESVTDRPTRAHEYIFLLSKSATYYYDHEAIKEPGTLSSEKRYALAESREGFAPMNRQYKESQGRGQARGNHADRLVLGGRKDKQRGHSRRHAGFNDRWDMMTMEEQRGFPRNKRDVWEVATEPYEGEHFATFPTKLIEPASWLGAHREEQSWTRSWVLEQRLWLPQNITVISWGLS